MFPSPNGDVLVKFVDMSTESIKYSTGFRPLTGMCWSNLLICPLNQLSIRLVSVP